MTDLLYVFAPLDREPHLVGRLDWRDGRCRFQYHADWLSLPGSYALDPRNLPLRTGPNDTTLNGGLHGVFSDAGPDAWGRALIERERGPAALVSPLEALRLGNGTGTGALLFSQSRSRPAPTRDLALGTTLQDLERAAQAFAEGRQLGARELRLIFELGSSLGGARPKARLTDADAEHIAKFRRPGDLLDEPRLEWATLRLARMCGLDVPEHRLVDVNGRTALLVRRFDREGDERIHYLSMHALLNVGTVRPSDVVAPTGVYTYFGAASLYRRIGVPNAGPRMFERMLFNVLVGNTDDHTRNHGLLFRDGRWDLAPAFDMVPQVGNRHGIGLGSEGRLSTVENAFSALDSYGITLDQATDVYDRMREALRCAPQILEESGLSGGDIETALVRMSDVVRGT